MLLTRPGARLHRRQLQLLVHRRYILPDYTRYHPVHSQRLASTLKMNTSRELDNLISFWFDRNPRDWFNPTKELDDEIRNRYLDLIQQARSGGLDYWAKEPKGVLGLVLLLDQFPRNIFRGSGESFSSDEKAAKLVAKAIAQGFDREIGKTSKAQLSVLYLPLMHAEDLVSQVACKALYEVAATTCEKNSDAAKMYEQSIGFAQRHVDCIAQLGRFPGRNEALGRPTTEEEKQYLQENPGGF